MPEHDSGAQDLNRPDKSTEHFSTGAVGGAALGSVIGLLAVPAAPLAILASLAFGSALGGLVTRGLMKDR